MNEKQKAKELIDKFLPLTDECVYPKNYNQLQFQTSPNIENSKECALICVDEIMDEHFGEDTDYSYRRYNYWQQVRNEIIN